MAKFSVLLLYPDYIASNYGQETFYEVVEAKNSKGAVKVAQKRAMEANEGSMASDFHALLCIAGDHESLETE